MNYWYILIFLLLASLFAYPQEILLKEPYPYSEKFYFKPFTLQSYKTQSLQLPFFDDFYQYNNTLKNNLWETDGNVQIHFGIGIKPPNRGVAVLDGATQSGQGYFEVAAQGIQERLISKPIDLSSFTNSDSIYFSFYFMHGGYGDKAESNDSLKLFFINNNQVPELVWFRKGGDTMQTFQKVIIPIQDSKFLHGQFQFFFETFGNLNGLFDQWLLDYIYLNKNRTYDDTLFSDLSFSDKRYSPFDSLMAIPLKQFQSHPWMSQDFIEITNLSANNIGRNLIWSINEIKNNTNLNPPLFQNQFFAFFPPYTSYPIPAFAEQGSIIEQYSRLQIQFSLNQNASDPQIHNDTLKLTFPIDTVWAYDDGEPETGYGLRTAKTFVQKFYNHTQDTLKAVMINFVPNLDIPSGKGFKLVILHQLHRDSMIYSKFYNLTHLSSRDSFNYFLLDSLVPLPQVYYIGITQPDNKPIGVGFDFSYNNNHNIYWDSSSVFVKSRLNGTLMIRPVMGSKPELAVSNTPTQNLEFSLFPNPFQDFVYFQSEQPITKLELYNSIGELLRAIFPDKKLYLGDLSAGIYFLKIYHKEQVCTKKLIKLP